MENNKTNKVYLKGSIDRFLKEWIENEYITEKVAQICRLDKENINELKQNYGEKINESQKEYDERISEIEKECNQEIDRCENSFRENFFSNIGIKFHYRDDYVDGYFIPSMDIAFEIMEKYDPYSVEKKTQRRFLKRDNYFLDEEQIKELFIVNKGHFKIEGLSEEKATVSKFSKKKTFLIKCAGDGAFDIISGTHVKNDKGSIYIPCCSLTKEEFINGLEKEDYVSNKFNNYKNSLKELGEEKNRKENELKTKLHNKKENLENEISAKTEEEITKIKKIEEIIDKRPDISQITRENFLDEVKNFRENTKSLYNSYKDKFEEDEIERAYRERLETNNKLNKVETLLVLLGISLADNYRAGINPTDWGDFYEKGNWELFSCDKEGTEVILDSEYAVRNPVEDCKDITHEVGIDFGTTSTVVSLCDNDNYIKFIRVGSTNFDINIKDEDYENPTVIEFIDYEKFNEDYNAFAGRPYTSKDDIKLSHEAKNDLNEKNVNMSCFFNDIKQWCGDSTATRDIGLEDKKGYEIHLKPFKNSSSSDFDPVEIYAYRLGLSINNVHNGGFYLRYLMSFPTSYEKAVRDKIRSSFEKGLKKSLPDAVLNDEEIMKKFSVTAKYSEPAAYALCALQKFGFKPKDDEKILYSVFDFGGGTTDIVFGIWRKADKKNRKERKYDYAIEPFREEGDRYLGGEYLLECLAYEVFKNNIDELSVGDAVYRFSKPEEMLDFSGSERLVKNGDTISRHNLLQLKKKLRYLWEGITEYNTKEFVSENEYNICGYRIEKRPELSFIENHYIEVSLRNSNNIGEDLLKLDVNPEKLINFLETRIKRGVESYFKALEDVLKNPRTSEFNTLHIFFAGNSCKSPIVYKVFEDYINNWKSEKITEIKIHHPLGTSKAKEEIDELEKQGLLEKSSSGEGNYEPTGKSGVAYGLVIDNVIVTEEISWEQEAKFKFYLGTIENDKFKVIIDRSVKYDNSWHTFGDPEYGYGYPADGDCIIYYTSLPDAISGELDKNRVKRVVASIENPDEGKDIYIRIKTPDTIEYGIGEMCNEEDGTFNAESIESIGELQLNP